MAENSIVLSFAPGNKEEDSKEGRAYRGTAPHKLAKTGSGDVLGEADSHDLSGQSACGFPDRDCSWHGCGQSLQQ